MQIELHELELLAHVGVTENERSRAQRVVLNITVWSTANPAQLEDNIDKTVDYSAIAHEAQELVRRRSVRLIETLANDIAAHLIKVFPISRACVEVRKFVLPQTSYVSVTVTRSA